MKHPAKWRETADPFQLPFHNFILKEILGYPHAGNDVFQALGTVEQQEAEVFIKVARHSSADIRREVDTIRQVNCPLAPQVIDFDDENARFVVTLAKPGERLSTIAGENADHISLRYMFEYGQALAQLHHTEGEFPPVKDRQYFHIPPKEECEKLELGFVHDWLTANRPKEIHTCFCHGDFHYANVLWDGGHISAILDFELSGMGNREYDIAWALILRPGQRFLNTSEEIDLFRAGYSSLSEANWDYVNYYMVQIYFYFYRSCGDTPGYREYIMEFFRNSCE